MIISRTPFRISFFGGGSDFPAWYNEHGGVVVSTSIDKYCYLICRYLPPFFDYNYRIRYTKREETKMIDEIQHPSVRECLRFLDFSKKGVEIQHNADVPAMSGLGSSSAFTVGLLHALYALKGQMIGKRQLALEAINIEQNYIKENVGSQDQAAAAFGGLNKITFSKQRGVEVSPLVMDDARLQYLQDHMILFFLGFARVSSEIAQEQIHNIPNNGKKLAQMMEIAEHAGDILCSKSDNLHEFGALLNDGWRLKRTLAANITNNFIDTVYQSAMDAGALGGKLLGAGSGGFMLIFARPEDKARIKEKLKDLLCVPFHFETLGSQIIFYSHDDYA